MKHLKVKARLLPDSEHFELTILEQSHKYGAFGNCRNGKEFHYKGVELRSYLVPEWYVGVESRILYFRGYSTQGDSNKLKIPLKYYPQIKAAIEAYNEYYKD